MQTTKTAYQRGTSDAVALLEMFAAPAAMTVPLFEKQQGALKGAAEYPAGMVAALVGVDLSHTA